MVQTARSVWASMGVYYELCPDFLLRVCLEIEVRDARGASSSSESVFHIYVRREGDHFVGLCGELRETLNAKTVDEIVTKASTLIIERSNGDVSVGVARLLLYEGPTANQGGALQA